MTTIVDDAELLRLAADPPRNAARLLDRAWAFAPLLHLLTVVLPLLAAACAAFDVETAVWGLKGLAIQQAESMDGLLIPGWGWRDDSTLFEPPLQAWLTSWLLKVFPVGSVAGLLGTSVLALAAAAAVTSRWIRQATTPGLGFTLTILLAVHSQWLLMAVVGSSDALSVLFLALTAWGIWGHWQDRQSLVTWKLLLAGLAWGLALLAGGILAVAFLATLFLWAILFRCESPQDCPAEPLEAVSLHSHRRWGGWALPILFVTGMACGGWWWMMMFEQFGDEFLWTWTTQDVEFTTLSNRTLQQLWYQELFAWFQRTAFLSGFLLLGIIVAAQRLWVREHNPQSQLRRFMALWSLIGCLIRLLPIWTWEWSGVSARHWESYVVIPLTYLAAEGMLLVLQRQVSVRTVKTLVVVTAACVAWSVTESWRLGLLTGSLAALILMVSSPVTVAWRRTAVAWNQKEIRRWIQAFAMLSVVGHALWGIDLWWDPPAQRSVYDNSRRRLRQIAPPQQISIITSEIADDPVQIEYLLRSLFPNARWSQSVGWDPELTKTVVAESRHPVSRMLVVEWSLRELRFRADIGTGWQVLPIVDPVPFLGRRFAVHLIEPVPTL